jgi:hypothetical protein
MKSQVNLNSIVCVHGCLPVFDKSVRIQWVMSNHMIQHPRTTPPVNLNIIIMVMMRSRCFCPGFWPHERTSKTRCSGNTNSSYIYIYIYIPVHLKTTLWASMYVDVPVGDGICGQSRNCQAIGAIGSRVRIRLWRFFTCMIYIYGPAADKTDLTTSPIIPCDVTKWRNFQYI